MTEEDEEMKEENTAIISSTALLALIDKYSLKIKEFDKKAAHPHSSADTRSNCVQRADALRYVNDDLRALIKNANVSS